MEGPSTHSRKPDVDTGFEKYLEIGGLFEKNFDEYCEPSQASSMKPMPGQKRL